ncbi:type IV pilin [Natranaeroarchaeum sulfidigenes]|uniref:Pilin/Flagellin, FlaG/FlaF family n=1 Tax=Natranaeroarchaeum sulfidigenes TaxID=2784880 RepID=A0A897MHH9_9EURY|nr:type IV pilin [Natranaeroarchaeum sulfidigenes]QSG01600.1 Pilin/Flagellin, FlaG/FlaF family [Natranaeroarchaeum sulfidigenes]
MSSPRKSSLPGDDRGVSPVIGVVLMIGIFVTMAAVIGAFVLGFSPTQAPPDTEMAYIEEGAAGVGVQVVMDTGEEVDSGNIEFQLDDGTQCEDWGGNGAISTGDETILSYCDGEDLEEGDTIQVIWTDDTESRSAIIDSYELRGEEVTLADDNCESYDIDREDDDIEIDEGDTVACDIGSSGDRWDAELEIEEDGILIGDVYITDEVDVDGGYLIGDDIVSDDEVEVDGGGEIGGDVTSDGEVEIQEDSEIHGNVDAGGDIDMAEEADQATIHGDVSAEGTVDLDEESQIGGDVIDTAGNTELNLDDSHIRGGTDIEDARIDCSGDSTIDGESC